MTAERGISGIEEYLLNQGYLSQDDLEKAGRFRKESGDRLYPALRKLSLIEPEILASAIADYHGVPLVKDEHWTESLVPLTRISRTFLIENNVVPLSETDEGVILAMEDPSDAPTIDAMRLTLRRPILPVVATAAEIHAAIERSAGSSNEPALWQDPSAHEDAGDDVEHLRDLALGTPVVRFVNQLIQDAVRARATDIHIEPFQNRLAIRMRVDGMLREISSPPAKMAKAVVSRIKILSGLNIAERRLPQDGRSRVRINQHRLDLRIATFPTLHGEALAIRLLDNVRRALDFSKLGFSSRDEEIIRKHLAAPYGLILVTGPTGSGKTTTLATALSSLNQNHCKILTIEDPIEYELDGINQGQVKPEIGLTFANALRSFLRHDPDVLMVGEMRDTETASIAVHAALTGHLVLSTLHTNTAAGAIPRLLDMGIDAFLLSSALRCVISQRLVRILCSNCKEPYQATIEMQPEGRGTRPEVMNTEPEQLWRATGCARCSGTGYNDRTVIAEVLDFTDEVKDLIQPNCRPSDIEAAAFRNRMTSMVSDGLRKCRDGITTIEEVRRVAFDI